MYAHKNLQNGLTSTKTKLEASLPFLSQLADDQNPQKIRR